MNNLRIEQSLALMTDRDALMARWAQIGEPFRPPIEKILGEAINANHLMGVKNCHELLNGRMLSGVEQGTALGMWKLREASVVWENGAIGMMVNTLIDCDFLDELTYPQQHRFNGPVSFFLQYDCHEAVDIYLDHFQPRESDVSQALCNTIHDINHGQSSEATEAQLAQLRQLLGLGANPMMTVPARTTAMRYYEASSIIMNQPCPWLDGSPDLLKALLASRGEHWGKPEGSHLLLAWACKDGCLKFAASQVGPDTLDAGVFAKVFHNAATFDMAHVKSKTQRTRDLLSTPSILPRLNASDLQEILLGAAIRSLRLLRTNAQEDDVAYIQQWWRQDPLLFHSLCPAQEKCEFLGIWNRYNQSILSAIETTAQALGQGRSEAVIALAEQQIATTFESILLQCDTLPAHGKGRTTRL